jgi:hypothetical protein
MVSAAGFEPATHALKGLLQVWCHAVPVCVYMYLRTYAILDTGKNRHSLVTFMVTFFGAPRLARGCGVLVTKCGAVLFGRFSQEYVTWRGAAIRVFFHQSDLVPF